jgi:DNA modification methylase
LFDPKLRLPKKMSDKDFEMQAEKIVFHTEQRKVSDLIPYEKNPRFLTPEQEIQLTESLQKFSLAEIPVINTDNKLMAGHQRVKILLKLGRGEDLIDVRVPNRILNQKEFDEYNIRSNANTGSWDVEMLASAFELPELQDWGLEVTKLKGFVAPVLEDEENAIPEVSLKTPVIKRGDIFQLGNHIVMCGDSKDEIDVAKLMNGRLAQMVFTDPPYNVKVDSIVNLGKTKHREFKEASGEMSVEEFTAFLTKVLTQLHKYSEEGSIHYICMDWKHITELLRGAELADFHYKQLCVWVKDNGGMGTFYRSKHELIFVFKKGSAKHINNFELGQNGRYRTNVWEYAGANSFTNRDKLANGKAVGAGDLKYHPTVKPLEMVCDALLDCSNPRGLVLDLFLGSGTTIVASERTGRICYGMELDEAYCAVTIHRFHNYRKQQGLDTPFVHFNGDLTLEQILPSSLNP